MRVTKFVIVAFIDADKQEQVTILCIVIFHPCGTSDLLLSDIFT